MHCNSAGILCNPLLNKEFEVCRIGVVPIRVEISLLREQSAVETDRDFRSTVLAISRFGTRENLRDRAHH